jgi:hypothetical protein
MALWVRIKYRCAGAWLVSYWPITGDEILRFAKAGTGESLVLLIDQRIALPGGFHDFASHCVVSNAELEDLRGRAGHSGNLLNVAQHN